MILRRIPTALCMILFPFSAFACGDSSECAVTNGSYRISLPEGAAGPIGAIVFAHGYQGTAKGTMKNTSLRKVAADRGLAFIAVDAGAKDWNLPGAPGDSVGARDEMAYLDAVMADAATRFGVDPKQTVISGFSAGGMFVWNVICARGDTYAGYIPYSGTFWKGPPEGCPAAAQNIIHVHGTADTTVPMTGRAIGDTRQGDLDAVMAMYSQDKGFRPGAGYSMADMTCSHSETGAGKRLDLCLFDGQHSFTSERLAAAYDVLMGK